MLNINAVDTVNLPDAHFNPQHFSSAMRLLFVTGGYK